MLDVKCTIFKFQNGLFFMFAVHSNIFSVSTRCIVCLIKLSHLDEFCVSSGFFFIYFIQSWWQHKLAGNLWSSAVQSWFCQHWLDISFLNSPHTSRVGHQAEAYPSFFFFSVKSLGIFSPSPPFLDGMLVHPSIEFTWHLFIHLARNISILARNISKRQWPWGL